MATRELWSDGSQSVLPGPALSASGNLLEMQMTEDLHSGPTENEAWQSVF